MLFEVNRDGHQSCLFGGSGHLVGEDGLFPLLKRAGFAVTKSDV